MPSRNELALLVQEIAKDPRTDRLAEFFNVSPQTIRQWKQDQRFAPLVESFIHEQQQTAQARFAEMLGTAVDTLTDLMSPATRSSMARFSAASKVVDIALAYQAQDSQRAQADAMDLLRRIAQNQEESVQRQQLPHVEHGGLLPAALRSTESELERRVRQQRDPVVLSNDDESDDDSGDVIIQDDL